MKTYLDCIPCFFGQALRAGRIATNDEKLVKHLLDELGVMLKSISLDSTPPETVRLIYRMVSEITGNPDPFRELKHESTRQALDLYPSLKKIIDKSGDSLLTAIRIAIAGNVIDFGANATFDIDMAIKETLEKDFAICDYTVFKTYLARSERVLYIGDNAGETVFDRLLIEQMNKPVIYVVRETPVINDATFDDAVCAGIDKVATIVSSGTDAPGTILSTCSPEFKQMLDQSEFVIAKGQGNYEGLSNENRPIFFLLKVKCKIIADDIGVVNGDILLKGINL
jgi:damage-control phosphatase, subfamily I